MAENEQQWQVESLKEADFQTFASDPRQWFVGQSQARGLTLFLAHDDDGVMWGKVENGQLRLSGEAFDEVKVELRALTLQQARLFGPAGELLVWRGDGGKWHGRYLHDEGIDSEYRLPDETHWLWGKASHPPGPRDGFTLMRDGVQGFLHAPPIELPDPAEPRRGRRAGLRVRHYLKYDDQGHAYIALSRLVKLVEVK
jgi:CRISPR-associated protein (TIGR03984 family)